MPNWCEGTLKMRGKAVDIAMCLKDCLVAVEAGHFDKNTEEWIDGNEYPAVVTLNGSGELFAKFPKEFNGYKGGFWIRDSRRHFVGDVGGIYSFLDDEAENTVVVFDSFRAAWQIDSEPFKGMAKKYGIDIRAEGFDRGMQLHQIVEANRDGSISDNRIEYSDWRWECPCPEMGG